MIVISGAEQVQIDRILNSTTLRSSDGMRRLLKFLADKALNGEADQLKEYTIGLDAFGKSSTYDPQQDSHVRIQVGRLRQKLAEYYESEGKNDPIVVKLPKGGFKLFWQPRVPTQNPFTSVISTIKRFALFRLRRQTTALIIVGTLGLVAAGWAISLAAQLRKAQGQSSSFSASWTPELEELWAPFLATDRPLLVSVSSPLFVTVPGVGYFRDNSVNRKEDVLQSTTIATLQKALKVQEVRPENYWTPAGEVGVIFTLGKLLAARKPNMEIVKSTELSWQQLSENNILFIGHAMFFNEQLRSMPVKQELTMDAEGIHNAIPRVGEPAIFVDELTPGGQSGVCYVLISHIPGPLGNGDIDSFMGRVSAGRIAAVQAFTGAANARMVVGKMRSASGKLPRYFQIVLRVRIQGGLPMETSYVLHRVLANAETK